MPVRDPCQRVLKSRPNVLRPIIVVDETDTDRFLFTRLLTKAGFKNPLVFFSEASKVLGFLESVASTDVPFALLSDLKILGGDGFEIVRWVQAHPQLSGMRLAIISGSDNPADLRQADELGVKFFNKFPPASALEAFLRAGADAPAA
jgi:CheY-like chemotaxis protein